MRCIKAQEVLLIRHLSLGTELETSIGAVSRVKAFATEIASENLPSEDGVTSQDWPQRGLIEFRGVSASYKYAFHLPLKDTADHFSPDQWKIKHWMTSTLQFSRAKSLVFVVEVAGRFYRSIPSMPDANPSQVVKALFSLPFSACLSSTLARSSSTA